MADDPWTLEIHYRLPADPALAARPIYRDRGPTVLVGLDAQEVQDAVRDAVAKPLVGGVVIYRSTGRSVQP